MNAVIIDDEAKARQNIINLLKLTNSNIFVVGEGFNVESGYNAIKNHHPDVVFLDIQMPDGSGFNLLKRFDNIDFQVIFITAFDQFAIDAFKYNAVDYLLKPINPEEFVGAIKRVEKRVNPQNNNQNLKNLLESLLPNSDEKITLKTSEGMHLVNINDIIRCESDKGYTFFFLNSGKKILVSTVIKSFENTLIPRGFLRTHQSHLVNINFVESFIKADGGYLLLKDGSSVPVSKRKREEILSSLEKMTLR